MVKKQVIECLCFVDIDILDRCFDDASQLYESERSTLYFISGYVAFKENIGLGETNDDNIPDSEFTKLVSRNKLSHPPSELYDLSLYVYFKARSNKCLYQDIFRSLRVHI